MPSSCEELVTDKAAQALKALLNLASIYWRPPPPPPPPPENTAPLLPNSLLSALRPLRLRPSPARPLHTPISRRTPARARARARFPQRHRNKSEMFSIESCAQQLDDLSEKRASKIPIQQPLQMAASKAGKRSLILWHDLNPSQSKFALESVANEKPCLKARYTPVLTGLFFLSNLPLPLKIIISYITQADVLLTNHPYLDHELERFVQSENENPARKKNQDKNVSLVDFC